MEQTHCRQTQQHCFELDCFRAEVEALNAEIPVYLNTTAEGCAVISLQCCKQTTSYLVENNSRTCIFNSRCTLNNLRTWIAPESLCVTAIVTPFNLQFQKGTCRHLGVFHARLAAVNQNWKRRLRYWACGTNRSWGVKPLGLTAWIGGVEAGRKANWPEWKICIKGWQRRRIA